MTAYLTTENLLVLIEELGGLQVRDYFLLDSAAPRPQATVFVYDAYPDLDTQAAVLLPSIARHPPLLELHQPLSLVAVVGCYRLT